GISVPSATYLDLAPSTRPDTVLHLTSCLRLAKGTGTHDCHRKPLSVQYWETSIDSGFSKAIQYSITRLRVVWVPFNYPTNLFLMDFNLVALPWGFLIGSQRCPKRRRDIFTGAGNFWLHLLTVSLASRIVDPDSSFFNNLVRSVGSTFRQLPCRQLQGGSKKGNAMTFCAESWDP
ncbi:hypothetical protein LB504_008890, partial [Fusarium proliferatum]